MYAAGPPLSLGIYRFEYVHMLSPWLEDFRDFLDATRSASLWKAPSSLANHKCLSEESRRPSKGQGSHPFACAPPHADFLSTEFNGGEGDLEFIPCRYRVPLYIFWNKSTLANYKIKTGQHGPGTWEFGDPISMVFYGFSTNKSAFQRCSWGLLRGGEVACASSGPLQISLSTWFLLGRPRMDLCRYQGML